MSGFSAVILAAGMGKRMKSDTPKVLFEICGKSLLGHVITNLEEAGADEIAVVCGHKGELVAEACEGRAVCYTQKEQLGTAHAVLSAKEFFENKDGFIAVVCGDAPLVDDETLDGMRSYMSENSLDMCVLTANLDDPANYGRIIRDENGNFLRITERKDCSQNELSVHEVNSGTMMFSAPLLNKYLPEIKNNNSQKEYYLTDIVEIFLSHGHKVGAYITDNRDVVLGANDRYELYLCETAFRRRINRRHMLGGVRIIDSETTYIDRSVKIAEGTVIYPSTIILGNTEIGRENLIVASRIDNCKIGDNNVIDNTVMEESSVGSNISIGPYTHIRANTFLSDHTKVGSFAETKNTRLGEGSKIPHLIYAGDAEIGKNVNLGCGVITANYDGKNKHKTVIEDDCFIGCNTNLVAPITVGKGSFIAAGTTVSRDIAEKTFVVARPEEKRKDVEILKIKKS